MNRENRRSLEKKARAKGATKEEAQQVVEVAKTLEQIRYSDAGANTPPQEIATGDKVMLNLQAIKARKNYDNMLPSYKEFVEENEGTVFTARVEHEHIVSMQEFPRWIFWSGDLIKMPQEQPTEEP